MDKQDKSPVIELINIWKTYRRSTRPALSGFSLRVLDGERLGMIGPNGSGKTTVLRLILNFIRPDSGEVRIHGATALESNRHRIGFVPERQEGMENFTPRELLGYATRMYSIPREDQPRRVEEMLDFTGLKEVADELLSGFSKGMSQRLQIGLALVHSPSVLLLDEPMSGLDPTGQKDVLRLLQQLDDITIVYASHNLEDIETFCDSVAIINHGKLVDKVSLSEVSQEIYTLEIRSEDLAKIHFPQSLQPTVLRGDQNPVVLELQASAREFQEFIQLLNQSQIEIAKLRSRSKLDEYIKFPSTGDTKPSA